LVTYKIITIILGELVSPAPLRLWKWVRKGIQSIVLIWW